MFYINTKWEDAPSDFCMVSLKMWHQTCSDPVLRGEDHMVAWKSLHKYTDSTICYIPLSEALGLSSFSLLPALSEMWPKNEQFWEVWSFGNHRRGACKHQRFPLADSYPWKRESPLWRINPQWVVDSDRSPLLQKQKWVSIADRLFFSKQCSRIFALCCCLVSRLCLTLLWPSVL